MKVSVIWAILRPAEEVITLTNQKLEFRSPNHETTGNPDFLGSILHDSCGCIKIVSLAGQAASKAVSLISKHQNFLAWAPLFKVGF